MKKKSKQKIQLELRSSEKLSNKVDFICPCADISEVKRTLTRLKNQVRTLRKDGTDRIIITVNTDNAIPRVGQTVSLTKNQVCKVAFPPHLFGDRTYF